LVMWHNRCSTWLLNAICIIRIAFAGKQSYYEVLELGRDASAQDVRRQFRKLSVQHHPDKNAQADSPEGRAKYARIQEAHEWLSSDDKRQLYDLYGEWKLSDDRVRGHQFAGRHTVEFFRDEPLIKNVRSEVEANQIFGLKTQRAYLMLLYSPWLTSCMEATSVYRKVANQLREATGEDGVQLAAVNCESNLQQFCLRYGRLRSQFSLPVVLLLDPTESLIDRYRGRMNAEELFDYTVASDKGIRHVHRLDHNTFLNTVTPGSPDFWLVLFCSADEPLCLEMKPVLKRLAYSAKDAAKVGLVNCKHREGADGYYELEAMCQDEGVSEVPVLMAYRRGRKADDKGEVIPLLLDEDENPNLAAPLGALRAM